jgi:hypothetical protein
VSTGRVLTPQVLSSLNEFGMEPAPSFRTVDLGVTVSRNLWASTRPHVCYAACLPAAGGFRASARFHRSAAGWPDGSGRGSPGSFTNPSGLLSLQGVGMGRPGEDFLLGYGARRQHAPL